MSEDRFNLLDGERKYGPYTKREIASMLGNEEVTMETLCIRVGDSEVLKVGELYQPASAAPAPEHEFEDDEEDWGDDEDQEDLIEEVEWQDGIWMADDEEDEDESQDHESASQDEESFHYDQTLVVLHPSFLAYPKFLITFFLFIVGSTILLAVNAGFGTADFQASKFFTVLGYLGAIVIIVLLVIYRRFDRYIITRTRAEVVRGIFAKSSNEVRISDVRRIDVDKPGFLGLLNIGDVKLSSAGTGGFDVVFGKVRNGHRVKKILRSVQRDPNAPKAKLVRGRLAGKD